MDKGRTVSLPGVYIKYHCLARNKVKATTAGMTHCGPGGQHDEHVDVDDIYK